MAIQDLDEWIDEYLSISNEWLMNRMVAGMPKDPQPTIDFLNACAVRFGIENPPYPHIVANDYEAHYTPDLLADPPVWYLLETYDTPD